MNMELEISNIPYIFEILNNGELSDKPIHVSNAIKIAILAAYKKIKEYNPIILNVEVIMEVIKSVDQIINFANSNEFYIFFSPVLQYIKLQYFFNSIHNIKIKNKNVLINNIKKKYKDCYGIIIYMQLIKNRIKQFNTKYNIRNINKSHIQWKALDICCNYYINVCSVYKKQNEKHLECSSTLIVKWNNFNNIFKDEYIKNYI